VIALVTRVRPSIKGAPVLLITNRQTTLTIPAYISA